MAEETEFLPIYQDGDTGKLRVYALEDGAAVEVLAAWVRPMTPIELASLARNLYPFLAVPRHHDDEALAVYDRARRATKTTRKATAAKDGGVKRHTGWRNHEGTYTKREGIRMGVKAAAALDVIREAGADGIKSVDVLAALGFVGAERRNLSHMATLRQHGLVRTEGVTLSTRYFYVPESERGGA